MRRTALPRSPAKIFFASSTAANETDTAWRAISVSPRTFLATANAWVKSVCSTGPIVSHAWARANASFTWPRICGRSEEHTSELQSRGQLVCRLLLEKKKRRARPEQHDCHGHHMMSITVIHSH